MGLGAPLVTPGPAGIKCYVTVSVSLSYLSHFAHCYMYILTIVPTVLRPLI